MKAIEIAKIVKPQGIKGEVKALPLTNVLAVFNDLKEIIIDGKTLKVYHSSFRQGFLYLQIEGINSRNDAENLRNKFIQIEKAILDTFLPEDEFLIDDLIGMTLYDLEGEYVGQIMDVVDYGSGDVFIIEKAGRTIEAPYVEKAFIKKGNKLVVDRKGFDEVAI